MFSQPDDNHVRVEEKRDRSDSLIQLEQSPSKSTKKSLIIDFSDFSENKLKSAIVTSVNIDDYLPIKDFDYNENFVTLENKFSKIEANISKYYF